MDRNKIKLILNVKLSGDHLTKYRLMFINPYYYKEYNNKYFFSKKEFMIYCGTRFEIDKDMMILPILNTFNIPETSTLYANNDVRKMYMKSFFNALLEWSKSVYWKGSEFEETPRIRCIGTLWYVY